MDALIIFVFLTAMLFGVIVITSLLKGVAQIFARPYNNRSGYTNNNQSTTSNTSSKPKKIFSKDEGQYITYEEIND